MNKSKIAALTWIKHISFWASLSVCNTVLANAQIHIVDDFNHDTINSFKHQRVSMTDIVAGGGTQANVQIKQGKLNSKGNIAPPRGQPGWSSIILPLAPEGKPFNASQYQGIYIKLKINEGTLSLSANTLDITNFDYHAAMLIAPLDGKFHEINIPFNTMQRTWSQPIAINTTQLNSISITAFGLQAGSFDFEIDEVGFY